MPEIVIKNATKRFGDFVAVDKLDITIEDKGFVTLLGPSGCGKTTTLRMISGLESPTEGEIYIDGELVFSSSKGIDWPPAKRDVGFLFQNYALWPHMTVEQNISFGLENLKWRKADIKHRIGELTELLKIEEFTHRYPTELSGGQQQRVAIARTLAPNPRVLFMDEPLSNLDAKLRIEMRAELKRLHLETNSTFVYVTHDQLEAMTLSSRICLMKEGRVQQYVAPLEVYNNPTNLFCAEFVGNPTINFIDVVCEKDAPAGIRLASEDHFFKFTPLTGRPILKQGQVLVLGLRPEHVSLSQDGSIKSNVYSTLPSGMETIVMVRIKDTLLTSVAFGGLDYEVDSEIGLSLNYDNYILFDKTSGSNIATGSLKMIQKDSASS
jgi:multiple sugar transport system ATP-binding protein